MREVERGLGLAVVYDQRGPNVALLPVFVVVDVDPTSSTSRQEEARGVHWRGRSWAEIGDLVGQRSRIVTADRYTHALVDYREIDRAKLLARVRAVPTSVHTPQRELSSFAGAS